MTDVTNVQAGAAQVTARPGIQVVPLQGLPIVAAVVAFVAAAFTVAHYAAPPGSER